jgi:hypothetical protein
LSNFAVVFNVVLKLVFFDEVCEFVCEVVWSTVCGIAIVN